MWGCWMGCSRMRAEIGCKKEADGYIERSQARGKR